MSDWLHDVHVYTCWPLPSDQSSYRQIAWLPEGCE